MRKHVIAFAVLGLLAVLLRSMHHLLPFGLLAVGLLVSGFGFWLMGDEKSIGVWNLGRSSIKPGTGHSIANYGLLVITASLTQAWLDGNPWLLIAPLVVAVFAALCIQQKGASELDRMMWGEVGQTIFAIMLPTLGLVLLRFRTETGPDLLLTTFLLVGAATFFGWLLAPRSFIRITKARYQNLVA